MRLRIDNNDKYDEEANDKPDFFEGNDIPETEKEKREKYKRDDPRYWQQPPSRWEHLRGLRKAALWTGIAIGVFAIICLWALWTRYFVPISQGGVEWGYVEKIERQGNKLKTFEGILIPFKDIHDTTRIYQRDFVFSAKNDNVAATLKRHMLDHKPVRVEYEEYQTAVPWRGNSRIVVTRVDTADTSKILTPYGMRYNP